MNRKPSQNIDLNLLKVFVVTYHERNLKKAAIRLSSTAPSVSVKLARLKERVGGELFYKTTTGFEPTELADQLFAKVDPLLSSLFETIDFLDHFDPAQIQDPIIMDIGQNLIPWLAPALQKKILAFCPQTHLTANYFTDTSISRLHKGEVNIGLQVRLDEVPKDILEIPLGHLQVGAIVRKNHPFPHNEAYIRDLIQYDFAIFEPALSGLSKGGYFFQNLEREKLSVSVKFRSPSMYALCELIKTTDMILPVDENLMKTSSSDLRMIKLLNDPEMTRLPVSAYIHQRNRHSAKHEWFVELIREEVSQAG